ncbi:MAG: YwiC-like family protein [Prochloraceae cyanobacterium]
MTQAELPSTTTQTQGNRQAWYRPTFSPEHGVYVVLFGSFLTGAALAQDWTFVTSLALVSAFCGFQAEYPLSMQLKQRSSWKPRLLVWGGCYGLVALVIALWLSWRTPSLLWLYGTALAALVFDGIEVLKKERKSILNEVVTFAAVCLVAPITATATTGSLTVTALALWSFNALFFSSSIFTVKLRKPKTSSFLPGLIYHIIALLGVLGLYLVGLLPLLTILPFTVAIARFSLVIGQQQWYRRISIGYVALIETIAACLFVATVALSLLPLHSH